MNIHIVFMRCLGGVKTVKEMIGMNKVTGMNNGNNEE